MSTNITVPKSMPKIRSAYDGSRLKVISLIDTPSATNEELAQFTDLNNILNKYGTQSVIDAHEKWQGNYGDVSGADYQEHMTQIAKANEMWNDFPAKTKAKFGGDIIKFLDYLAIPDNQSDPSDGVLLNQTSEVPGEVSSSGTSDEAAAEGSKE
jgi:hypothetical protein